MLRFKLLLVLFGMFVFYPVAMQANTVVDVFNHYRRQIIKNDRLDEQLNVLRQREPLFPKGSVDIGDYVGREFNLANGEKKLVDNTPYDCKKHNGFDSGYGCRDWALEGTEVITSKEHFRDIRKILGDSLPLDASDENHLSVGVEYMRCLAGTSNKGTVMEYNEVPECKELVDWTSNVLLLEDLANMEILEYMFAPKKQYFVVKEDGRKVIKNRPSEEAGQQSNLNEVDRFIRKDLTLNVCAQMRSSSEGVIDQASTARRLILAQGYAHSVASRRTAELFSRHAVPYLHSLTATGSEFNPKTIRQDIHLLLAADAGIIYLLGQINGLQGMLTELKTLDNNLGGIKNFNGITHLVGDFKTQEELCK